MCLASVYHSERRSQASALSFHSPRRESAGARGVELSSKMAAQHHPLFTQQRCRIDLHRVPRERGGEARGSTANKSNGADEHYLYVWLGMERIRLSLLPCWCAALTGCNFN